MLTIIMKPKELNHAKSEKRIEILCRSEGILCQKSKKLFYHLTGKDRASLYAANPSHSFQVHLYG